MDQQRRRAYWRANLVTIACCLVIWAFVSLGCINDRHATSLDSGYRISQIIVYSLTNAPALWATV